MRLTKELIVLPRKIVTMILLSRILPPPGQHMKILVR